MNKKSSYKPNISLQSIAYIITIVVILSLMGCHSSIHHNHTHKAKHIKQKYRITDTSITEYITRIGKRITVISNFPNKERSFILSTSSDPFVKILANKDISISKGLLADLKNEAQLAAVISYAFIKLETQTDTPALYTEQEAMIDDQKIISYLERAGYEANELLALQKQGLPALYKYSPVTAARIENTKEVLKKIPLGLNKYTKRYQTSIRG